MVTAIECALAGHRVTLLDRGPIPNPASTSADQHRALRVRRPGDPVLTARMADARKRWLGLESVLGTEFLRLVGIVTAWPVEDAEGELVELPHVVFPGGTVGVLDPDAGVLLADKFLHAAARWLADHPAVSVRPECSVRYVADHWVSLSDGTALGADAVVVAAGPWSRDLVDVPVALFRQTMVYLRPPADLASWWETAPGVGGLGADGRAWLLPPGEGTLLKISSDVVCRKVDSTTDGDLESWGDWLPAAPRAARPPATPHTTPPQDQGTDPLAQRQEGPLHDIQRQEGPLHDVQRQYGALHDTKKRQERRFHPTQRQDRVLPGVSADAWRAERSPLPARAGRLPDLPWAERLLAEPILSELDRYTVVAVRECHYAAAPDTGGPLLIHPRPGLWVRPACGGSGFAAAPLVANTIVEAMEASA
ncbi:NAD(P)/FAD-dependent oxidoreductase [Kutzneria sp. NPDC052558]|uniref:NAD(P)/FAD-dependent oxidoreductase n=1 Tax=Kutzneria sp. NPDC052558 TaxID=3364121 RepID=UPI0037C567FB